MHETLKVFCCDYDSGESITSEDECLLSVDESIECMESLSDTDGNFFGIELPDGAIVQFMHDDNRGLILDIPDVAEGGSHTRVVDPAMSLQIIRDMYNGKSPRDIEGLVFESY